MATLLQYELPADSAYYGSSWTLIPAQREQDSGLIVNTSEVARKDVHDTVLRQPEGPNYAMSLGVGTGTSVGIL